MIVHKTAKKDLFTNLSLINVYRVLKICQNACNVPLFAICHYLSQTVEICHTVAMCNKNINFKKKLTHQLVLAPLGLQMDPK